MASTKSELYNQTIHFQFLYKSTNKKTKEQGKVFFDMSKTIELLRNFCWNECKVFFYVSSINLACDRYCFQSFSECTVSRRVLNLKAKFFDNRKKCDFKCVLGVLLPEITLVEVVP